MDLEKAKELEIHCQHPLVHRKSKIIPEKQDYSRKASTSGLLTMLKPLTLWIKTHCGKFLEMEIPEHHTCLLRNLYTSQEATIRTGHGTTDWFQIGKGVHQGCILSPCLINLCAEYIM